MPLTQVHTQPDPYAPFLLSQAIALGNLVFVSGQAAIGDDGAIVGKGDFDAQAVQLIWVETPPPEPEWAGVRDRLRRASAA